MRINHIDSLDPRQLNLFIGGALDAANEPDRAAQATGELPPSLPTSQVHLEPQPAVRSVPASTKAASASTPPTFAEAVVLIDSWMDTTLKQRRDLKAALSTAATMIGQPMANISCAPAFLNRAFYARPPEAFGMLSRYASQVGSRLRKVLRRLGWHADAVMREDRLGTEWAAFLGRMAQTPQRSGLRAFAAWCDGRAVSPAQASPDELLAFCAHEFETRLFAGHAGRAGQLARLWRTAVGQQDNPSRYPLLKLTRKREAYVPPLSAFPDSFQADMAARRAHLSRSNGRISSATIDGQGPSRALEPVTIEHQEFPCGRRRRR